MLNLGFLASHNGSAMRAIVTAIEARTLNAKVCIVISNNVDATALAFAKEHGVPIRHISATKLGPGADVDAAVADALSEAGTDVVILSGYMRKLGPHTLARFPNRILNIHPGPLPRFGGPGMFGKHVHEAVIKAGMRASAVTIHVVDANYDQGPILAQRKVMMVPGDTAESLANRVQTLEPDFFVDVLRRLSDGTLPWPR